MQLLAHLAGGNVDPRQPPGVRPGQRHRGRRPAVPRVRPGRGDAGLDEPRRPRGRRRRPATASPPGATTPRSRRSSTTEQPLFGVQFHPEVAHTPRGGEILNNFLFEICGCAPDWTPGHFVESEVARIRELVGPDAAGHLRAVGRRGQLGGGGAGAPRGRRPADLHLRGPRPAPAARAGAGGAHVPAPPGHRPARGGRERAVPGAAGRRRRPGGEAAEHRPHLHRRVRGGGEDGGRRTSASWCRERSIPT